jgi:hypothetical protein
MAVSNSYAPKDCGALNALNELAELLIRSPDMGERFRDFVDIEAPFFSCHVDHPATEATGKFVVAYEPSDALQALLAAMRAEQRKPNDGVDAAAGHSYG